MKITLIFIIFATFLTNTTKKRTIQYSFKCNFPKYEKPIIRFAFVFWNNYLNHTIFKENKNCKDKNSLKILYIFNNFMPKMFDGRVKQKKGESVIAVYEKSKIYFFKKYSKLNYKKKLITVLHEIGHFLKIKHSKNKKCIMHRLITYKNINLCNSSKKQIKESEIKI